MTDFIFPGTKLSSRVEALLFVASEPVTKVQLAEALEMSSTEIEKSIEELRRKYSTDSGLKIQNFDNKYQLTTSSDVAADIEKYLGLEATAKLSNAALETLAIVAYRQPVTRPIIDEVRGVISDSVIKNLLFKGLIEEVGRAETPGRPILYRTTQEFLLQFGLNSLDDLPPFEVLDQEGVSEEDQRLLKD
ncbi:MAG TPA: SMC-Scp complex subunit ScpB [Bellilinea sp.]|nr:SMC-Scp complex subunit ScpB [Bellilinea sp.]